MKRLAVLAACLLACLAAGPAAAVRNDYANAAFNASLSAGLRAFYTRDFASARKEFEKALAVVPDNTLAISFLNATAVQTPGELDALINAEEDVLGKAPKSYIAHVRLGFSYMFASLSGRNRDVDAREELNSAVTLAPGAQAAHVGLGIMREGERSANRAKVEFLAALEADKNNVLAREYLARIYQVDLKDPQRGLAYVIDIPNVVPDYADIYYHVASLLDDLKQPDAAIKYATRGLETDVGHVGEAGQHGYTLLARIYLDEKKLDDARRVLRASISANTDTAYAQTLLRKLDNGDYGSPKTAATAAPKKK
ncbi:MAG: tetratricopeptide repeat protein [Candidatus Velthaea sp.]